MEELDIGPLGAKNINGMGAAVGDSYWQWLLDIFITVGDYFPGENRLF